MSLDDESDFGLHHNIVLVCGCRPSVQPPASTFANTFELDKYISDKVLHSHDSAPRVN